MIKVTLYVAGLFVFVEYEDGVHALAPRTDQHAHGGGDPLPRHVASLFWAVDGGPLMGVPFDDLVLRLHPPGAATPLKVPNDQIDLDGLTGRPLQRRLVRDPLDCRRLHARVDLGNSWDGMESFCEQQFTFPASGGGTQTLPKGVWATLTKEIDSPFGIRASLVSGAGVTPLALPVLADLTLLCVHVPEDLLRDPDARTSSAEGPVTHFRAYYDLYEPPPRPNEPEIGVPSSSSASAPCRDAALVVSSTTIQGLFDILGGTTKTCPTTRATIA